MRASSRRSRRLRRVLSIRHEGETGRIFLDVLLFLTEGDLVSEGAVVMDTLPFLDTFRTMCRSLRVLISCRSLTLKFPRLRWPPNFSLTSSRRLGVEGKMDGCTPVKLMLRRLMRPDQATTPKKSFSSSRSRSRFSLQNLSAFLGLRVAMAFRYMGRIL